MHLARQRIFTFTDWDCKNWEVIFFAFLIRFFSAKRNVCLIEWIMCLIFQSIEKLDLRFNGWKKFMLVFIFNFNPRFNAYSISIPNWNSNSPALFQKVPCGHYNILIFFFLFWPQKVKKNTLKSCSEFLKSTFFSLLPRLPKRPKQIHAPKCGLLTNCI